MGGALALRRSAVTKPLEVGMVPTPCGHHACGGMAFTSMFVRAIVRDERFRHQRHHCTLWREGASPRPASDEQGDRTVAVNLMQTRRPGHRRGGNKTPCHRGPVKSAQPGTSWGQAPGRAGVVERRA